MKETRYKTVNLAIRCIKKIKKSLRLTQRYAMYGADGFIKDITYNDTHFKIKINPTKNGCVDKVIADTGLWEPAISTWLQKNVSADTVFVDIGANIGYHSLFTQALHNGQTKVYAIEPILELAEQIKLSAKENHFTNLVVYNCGVGNETQELDFHIRDENMGGSSVHAYDEIDLVSTSDIRKIKILLLDTLLPKNTKVDIIKIDVEGYEFEALQGAQKILETHHPKIILEFSPLFYEHDREGKTLEFINYLESLNYTFQDIEGHSIHLRGIIKKNNELRQMDIICS